MEKGLLLLCLTFGLYRDGPDIFFPSANLRTYHRLVR